MGLALGERGCICPKCRRCFWHVVKGWVPETNADITCVFLFVRSPDTSRITTKASSCHYLESPTLPPLHKPPARPKTVTLHRPRPRTTPPLSWLCASHLISAARLCVAQRTLLDFVSIGSLHRHHISSNIGVEVLLKHFPSLFSLIAHTQGPPVFCSDSLELKTH